MSAVDPATASSAGLVAAGHSGSGGAVVMLAVLAITALVAFGIVRWRRRRDRAEQQSSTDEW